MLLNCTRIHLRFQHVECVMYMVRFDNILRATSCRMSKSLLIMKNWRNMKGSKPQENHDVEKFTRSVLSFSHTYEVLCEGIIAEYELRKF